MLDPKSTFSRERLIALRDLYRDTLLNDILPFWIQHAPDSRHGGFYTCVDRRGALIDHDKAVWQQGRFSWLLAELAHRVSLDPQWLTLAKSGIEFIQRHCIDPADGRMWFHVTQDGRPIRKRRYAFSESFAAIALGAYGRATGDANIQQEAIQTFQRYRQHHLEPPREIAKFEATRPTQGIGYPMIGLITAQELRASVGLEGADEVIDGFIAQIESNFVKPELECVMETVGVDGEVLDHFDGRTLNPGHAIEGSWFIMNEGKRRGDPELIALGCRMLDWMWARGWDEQFGGLLYFASLDGRPLQEYWHQMKFWWPHNEAMIATLLAFQLTGQEKYARWHDVVQRWSFEHFPDPEYGEWFGYLNRDGSISSEAKGNFWKGPFHLPRMLLECWALLDELLESESSS